MDVMEYIKIGLRWWWLILISVVLSAGASYFYSQELPKIYSARSTLTVGSNIIDNPNPDVRNLGSIMTLAEVYAELVTRDPILEAVINKLGLEMTPEELGSMVDTNILPQVQLLEIYVLDVNPQRAPIIANALTEELILQSPDSPLDRQEREQFIRTQLADLQRKIEVTNEQIAELEDTLLNLTSAVEIAEAQSKLARLEQLKGEYQINYTQFLSNLSENTLNRLSVFELATEPTIPIAPNIRNNVLIAAGAGLALAIVAIVVIEFLDDVLVWSRNERILGLPVLGAVPKSSKKLLVAQNQIWSPETDMLRSLRNSISLAAEDVQLSTILITSATSASGKSFVSSNLAATIASSSYSVADLFASSGSFVILVDADLRKPSLHEIFDQPNLFGLADVLAVPEAIMENMLEKALKPTLFTNNLLLLPAGRTPDPASLLNSPQFVKVLQLLSKRADIVIIDSAPILETIDTKAIANVVDATILIVRDGKSRQKSLKQVIDYFQRKQNNNLLGIVFNQVKMPRAYGYNASAYQRVNWPKTEPSKPSFISWSRWQKGSASTSHMLAIAEVADQLGVSSNTVKRWCEDGKLPATKHLFRWKVALEDLNAFITAYQTNDDSNQPRASRKNKADIDDLPEKELSKKSETLLPGPEST